MQEINKEDFKKMCVAITSAYLGYDENPDGTYERGCPFCLRATKLKYLHKAVDLNMNNTKHDVGCIYNTAKKYLI